jgi:hypothetical protein
MQTPKVKKKGGKKIYMFHQPGCHYCDKGIWFGHKQITSCKAWKRMKSYFLVFLYVISNSRIKKLLLYFSLNSFTVSILTLIFRLGGMQCKRMSKKLLYDSKLNNSLLPCFMDIHLWRYIHIYIFTYTYSVASWSEFLATDPEFREGIYIYIYLFTYTYFVA